MSYSALLAKQLRDVHFGDNWCSVNLKDCLADVSWQEANTSLHNFNTIATLAHHSTYYVYALHTVLRTGNLSAKDNLSFVYPPITNQLEWEQMQLQLWANAELTAKAIELMPDDMLLKPFTNEKYGNYYRNMSGIIEHIYYHLGQMVLMKKILREVQ